MGLLSNRYFSLRITLFTAFLGTILFATILNSGISALHVRNLVKESIREKLQVAVGVGALQIDGDLHSQIKQPGDEKTRAYETLFKQLTRIREVNSDIKNVYTIRQQPDGGAIFIVDSDPHTEERASIGHKVIKITPAIKKAFAEKSGAVVEKSYFKDEWGTFVSGFAPIYGSDGKFEALLGMDVMALTVQQHQLNNVLAILSTSLLVLIVAVFLCIIISRKISRPVTEVTADMGEIQKLNLDSVKPAGSVIHEIREMTDALEKMKKGLRSFKKYVPTQLVTDLMKMNKEACLEVEKKHITILFTDIRGFTGISEKVSPEDLAEAVGIYFGGLTSLIMKTGGVVDKYIGDAIMALWGAPHDLSDHPVAACRAALACREKEKEINEILRGKGMPTFFTRMGINTGEALVGNIGYEERISYTAIDAVVVKGKTNGIRIYELLSELSEADQTTIARVYDFNKAMELYTQQKWQEALEIFETLKTNREDYPLKIMIERCNKFIADPPGDDFIGLVSLRTK